MRARSFRFFQAAAIAFTAAILAAHGAAAIEITDIAGRKVEVKQPIERMILGEGRQLYALATMDRENPFKRVVGWRDDFKGVDPEGYDLYKAKFPEVEKLTLFGNPQTGGFSVEKAISLKPDLVFMNFELLKATTENGLIRQLESLGVPVVFIDFREKPLENTTPSLRIMGKILQREDRAEAVIAFQEKESQIIYDRVAALTGPRSTAFIERAAGGGFFAEDCCATWGNESLGMLIERAGGTNIAASLLPGPTGTLNPEQVIVAKPDVYIITGSNWDIQTPSSKAATLGAGADPKKVADRMKGLAGRYGFANLPAMRTGRYHAVWHQFYNSPYMFVALQAFAKWMNPEAFKDVDPDDTFRRFHERFLPIEYRVGFFATLQSAR
jgi:iron complex transport system substrate-binding protein